MGSDMEYPAEAYYPGTNTLWWELKKGSAPAGTWGAIPRAASWLRWNVVPGERFTTRQLRMALGLRDQEHFQRRLRDLRDEGWDYTTSKTDPKLGQECVLVKYGWWPGEGKRPSKGRISAKLRRQVFARDGSRCVICGRSAEDFYDDGRRVVLTAGHIRPASLGGRAELDNLQTECSRCNEAARADTGTVSDPAAVLQEVKELKYGERAKLYSWIEAGKRSRSTLDRVYDDVRNGGPAVRSVVEDYLENLLGVDKS